MDVSIGELSRLTGLPVKTIRYYSDIGLVREARRTPAGYRRYDEQSLGRLELIRALRDLGIDLQTIARVAEQQSSLEDVARARADAIDLISVNSHSVGPCSAPSLAEYPDPRRYNE